MSVVINGTTGITAAAFDGAVDGADLTGTVAASLLTGTLPALNGSALTNLPAPTSAQVGTATAGLSVGAVGTYAYLAISGDLVAGSTYAGSSLFYAGVIHWGMTADTRQDTTNTWRSSTSPAGTWMAMGTTKNDAGGAGVGTVCLRIS